MKVMQPVEAASADGRDLLLPEGALVHLDNVRGRAQAVLHHKLNTRDVNIKLKLLNKLGLSNAKLFHYTANIDLHFLLS
jgi:hypothetical protein